MRVGLEPAINWAIVQSCYHYPHEGSAMHISQLAICLYKGHSTLVDKALFGEFSSYCVI